MHNHFIFKNVRLSHCKLAWNGQFYESKGWYVELYNCHFWSVHEMMGIKGMDKQDKYKTNHFISYCPFSLKPKQYLAQNFLFATACKRWQPLIRCLFLYLPSLRNWDDPPTTKLKRGRRHTRHRHPWLLLPSS